MAARKSTEPDPFREWCYNEPLLLDPAQMHSLLNSLASTRKLSGDALKHTLEQVLSEEQLESRMQQAADQLRGQGEPLHRSNIRQQAGELASQQALESLIQQGIIEPTGTNRYVPNHKALSEYLAKAAFDEAEKMLEGKRFSPRGKHRTAHKGAQRTLYDRLERSPRTTRGLSASHTLKNSAVRRASDPDGPLIAEEDIVRRKTRREDISYHVVMLIDISGSMASDGKIEGAIAAALSLGHYMRTKHRQDKLTIIAYDDRTRIVPFEYVHGLRPNGGTSTEIALARARDILADDRKRDGLVYLITDGQPNQPELAIEEAHGLREDGVKFIEVLLDDRYSYMYGGQNGGVGIGRRMAKAAGGLFIHVKDPAKIGAFFLEQYAVAKGRKRL